MGYDGSQRPSVDPSPCCRCIQFYSDHSTNEPYPLGFRPMPGAWPLSQGPADVQNASESRGSYLTDCTTIASTSGPFTLKWPDAPQEFDLSGEHNWHPQMPDPEPFFWDRGKRRALIIGINYSLHPVPGFRLEKCIEDAYGMANFLCANLGFEHNDVRIITDDSPWDRPTAENIREAMAALVYDAQPNDSLILYYSGHALQLKDMSGREFNGLAECICAIDYDGDSSLNSDTPGLISDYVMHQLMVKPLPRKCRLTAIFDSCHSGGLLGLPHVYDSNGFVKPLRHPECLKILRQKSSYADVVSLSASRDEQKAIETERGGALRWAFIESVRTLGDTLTYKELLCSVRDYMRRHGFPQRPQLSSSYEIDTYCRFIT